MEEKKNKIYTKWWFWVCIVAIVLIVGFVVIICMGFMIATSGLNEITLDIHNKVDANINVYSSTGESILILEFPNYTTGDEAKEKISQTLEVVKSHPNKLSNFETLIIYTPVNSDETEKGHLRIYKYILSVDSNNNVQISQGSILQYIDANLYIKALEDSVNAWDTTIDTYNKFLFEN